MFKSMLLSSTRYFAPENEQGSDKSGDKSDAQKERDKIKVETSKQTEQKEEDKSDDKPDDDKEEDKEEDKENDEEDDEKELELSDDAKKIAKLEKTIERLQKRVGRTTGEKAEIAKELAAAKASLSAKVADGEGLTEEEVERRAEIKATQKSDERAFKAAQAKLIKDATKVDKDFMTKVNEMAQDVAPIPGAMIGVLEDLDNGGEVLAHLAENPDVYEEIFDLPLARMATRLSKLSGELEEAKKEKPKKISKVPAPIEGIKGGSESPNILPEKPNKDAASMEKFVKLRALQTEQRRKQKLGLA